VRKTLSIGLFLFLWFFGKEANAAEVTIFGPEQYTRTSGPPNVYEDSFFAKSGTGKLIILNGAQSGGKKNKHSVSRALVRLNGKKIFGPRNFKKSIYYLEASVDLLAENIISIRLASSPGSYITVQVIQEIDPPTVAITAVPGTVISGEKAALSWYSTDADSCRIEPGIGEVEPVGSTEISPIRTTEYTIVAENPGGTSFGSTTVVVLHRPVASDDSITLDEDASVNGTLSGSDEDGENLFFSIVANGEKGTTAIMDSSTGAFTYTPAPNANGADLFTFRVNDGLLDSNTATVSVEIVPVNDAPEITGTPEPSVYENKTYRFQPSSMDADGDTLFFSIINQPPWAGFDGNTGLLSGIPTHAHVGTFTGIVIMVSDGELNSSLPAFDVTVIDPDVDKDGIEDLDEVNIYGTDPNALDTDADGIHDVDELATWGENWNTDYDGDGLTNLVDADSDNDGMTDGWELQNGLNLSVQDAGQDADGDGISNFAEYKLNMNPNDPEESVSMDITYEYDGIGGITKATSVLKKP